MVDAQFAACERRGTVALHGHFKTITCSPAGPIQRGVARLGWSGSGRVGRPPSRGAFEIEVVSLDDERDAR